MATEVLLDHEQQYKMLEAEILRLVHKPGDIISESSLCQRFGLSRTPARSLLQRLQSNGLIRIEPKRGSIVTKLNLNVINQLIYERFAVETMVLRDYIAACNPADVERVRFLFYQLKDVAAPYFDDREAFDTSRFLTVDLSMHSEWFRRMNLDYLWQRLSMVTGSLPGSVVANIKITYAGGSSRVLSSAFDAPGESIWASSSMYTLYLPSTGG